MSGSNDDEEPFSFDDYQKSKEEKGQLPALSISDVKELIEKGTKFIRELNKLLGGE